MNALHIKQKFARFVTAILIFGLLAACSSDKDDQTPDSRDVEETQVASQIYQGIRADLLGPHSALFHAEFTPADGSPGWRYDVKFQVNEPGVTVRRDLSISGLSANEDPGDVTLLQVGDRQYMIGEAVGTSRCLLFPADVDLDESFLTPDSFLPAANIPDQVLDRAGKETVAGQEGDVYTFEEETLSNFTNVRGALVQHPDGGWLRFTFDGDTADENVVGGGAGHLLWEYVVTALGTADSITEPAECTIDLPLMADASNIARLPGVIKYDTASPVAEVTAFYEQSLPPEGWGVFEFPQIRDEATVLTFARAGEILNVSVQATETGSQVQLFVEDR